MRVDGELDVGAAGVHPDFPHNVDGGVTHDLVFLVGQGLGRGHRYAVAGMHPHRVEILDGTDNDHVVGVIPHDLQFELLPPQDGFFDHDLVDETGIQSFFGDLLQVFGIVGHTAAGAAQGIGRPDDNRETDFTGNIPGLLKIGGDAAPGNLESDGGHCLPEPVTVFGLFNSIKRGPDHLHPELFQYPHLSRLDGRIQTGLSAQGGQEGVRAFQLDNPGHHFRRHRLNIGPVGHFRVGHDGGRVAVDQNHLIAFFFQGLAGLGAGVVKLAGLTDNDRARTDDHNFMQICPFRHGALSLT